MIAMVEINNRDDVVYLTTKDFYRKYTRKNNGVDIFLHPEARDWARFGRLYSRFQIDNYYFVRVEEENDAAVLNSLRSLP